MTLASISHLVAVYGYLAVFAAVCIESLGIPVPGETTLVAASVYAGATHRLSLAFVVAVAACAAILGDNLGYLIGLTGGERLLRRVGPLIRLDESKLGFAREVVARHGGKIVFLGRFFSVLRTYAAFFAGTSRMRWRRFLFFNAMGAVLWSTAFGVGAYEFGAVINHVGELAAVALGITAVTGVCVAFFLIRRYGTALRAGAQGTRP